MLKKRACFETLRLNFIVELGPVLHQCHIIAAEMVHFVQQVQYYINFEVQVRFRTIGGGGGIPLNPSSIFIPCR